jgi:two-component system, NarL family, invasion response regulator UvrY
MKSKINLLLVEHQNLVRCGIRRILEAYPEMHLVGDFENGDEAVEAIKKLDPPADVVLMEIKATGNDGLDTTKKIKRFSPDSKVLILTSADNGIYPTRLLELGVNGYLTKNASINELIQAIHYVHSDQPYVSSQIAQHLALKNFDSKRSPFELLSNRELQIAAMTAEGETLNEIAGRLHISTKTISTYRNRIFKKLKIRGDVALTYLALEYGLVNTPFTFGSSPRSASSS